ncbi:MAG: tRNA 4-thiouridine(8) synthase ThiI [Nanoarchaeota archaeon]|nr:tRNA 4-thiouridine(8) synthase ThiI [Nanoarchaeota archaeon]
MLWEHSETTMHNTIIVRYGEIALKGANRNDFEKQLVKNIKTCLKMNNIAFGEIKRLRGRIIVYSNDNCECLAYVFGIVSISPAVEMEADIEKIKQEALKHYSEGSFKVAAHRLEKLLGTSIEMNTEIGAFIAEKTNAKVDLKNPDVEIGIELFNGKAYVFNKTLKGPGGLPIGVSGKVAVLVEDKNAVRAALLMMKRGCEVVFVKKADVDLKEIEKYAYGFRMQVLDKMPKDAEAVVVSDTLETLKKREYSIPVLRPLIGE